MGANLKEVRERIKSVISTQQITKAMKMVSAAKLRRAQQAIVDFRPYAEKLNQMLVNILSNMDGDGATSFGLEREIRHAAVVVITSDRGLCGAFNTNIIKEAIQVIDTKYADVRRAGNLSIVCVGKKGYDFFRKKYEDCQINNDYVGTFGNLEFDNVSSVSRHLMQAFEAGDLDHVTVCYGRFKNAGMQFAETHQFLPVPKLEAEKGAKPHKADYIFEPSKQALLEHLIPSILQTSFHRFVLDNHASEHGARMTAMDKASENADDLLKELRINYNKARQEAITRELSEIVGGAAALGNE